MTTKELADRLTAECADDIYNQTVFAHLEDRDKSTVKECINESIPLLELLEVARAADWQLSLGKPHTGTPLAYPDGCECEACECWNKLERTLKSLEESGVKI